MSTGILSFHHLRKHRTRNARGRVKCPWSSIMYCDKHKHCPMEDKGFLSMLERWLMLGRSPKTASLEYNGDGYQAGGFDNGMIDKAEIYRLFVDPDGVDYFLSHHYARMHKRLCKDLARAQFLWREINLGFTMRQGETFYQREATKEDVYDN